MFDPKRYILAGGTVFAALAIGFVMQKSPSGQAIYGETQHKPALETQVASVPTMADAAPEAAQNTEESVASHSATVSKGLSGLSMSSLTEALAETDKEEMTQDAPVRGDAAPVNCEPQMTATPAQAAMVTLSLDAACQPNERVTIHHNGMMFTVLTDAKGSSTTTAPALAKQAMFIAAFADGSGAVATTMVDDLDQFDRVVLQWRGDAGFQIHALEYGADYGQEGHVWAEARGEIEKALNGKGGFIIEVGDRSADDTLRAEVYTFPKGNAARGDVVLSAEAEVTEANCARQIEAQALQLSDGGALKVQELALSVPSCDVVGDILMLKNLLQDLKIARN